MKSKYTFLKIVALLSFSLSSCKKDEPEIAPRFNYMTSQCKISSFTYGGNMNILTKYNPDHQLIEIIEPAWLLSPYEYRRILEYENGELKRIVVPSESPGRIPVPNKSYTEVEYEYGKYGVEKIHRYEKVDLKYNRPNNLIESERFEFQYKENNKPTGMNYYINFGTTEDKFVLGLTSTYEYDSNRNLTKEILKNTEVLGSSSGTSMYTYFYDNNINTIKQLNYLYFSPGLGAYIFSTNNIIRQQIISPDNVVSNIPFPIIYDSKNNATKFSYNFSNVVWDCQ